MKRKFFILIICFVVSGHWAKKKSAARWKFPGEVVKTALPVSAKTFWSETHFEDEILVSQSFFDIEQISCRFLAKAFQLSWKNWIFECRLKFLRKMLKLKFWFSNQFRSWARFFRILTKTLLHDGQNFILWSHRHIMRKKIFSKFLFFPYFFRTSIKSFGLLVKFFRPGCGICSLSVHRNPLINSLSSEEVSCVFLCGRNPTFWFKFLNGVVKNACYVSVKSFWGETFLY